MLSNVTIGENIQSVSKTSPPDVLVLTRIDMYRRILGTAFP